MAKKKHTTRTTGMMAKYFVLEVARLLLPGLLVGEGALELELVLVLVLEENEASA